MTIVEGKCASSRLKHQRPPSIFHLNSRLGKQYRLLCLIIVNRPLLYWSRHVWRLDGAIECVKISLRISGMYNWSWTATLQKLSAFYLINQPNQG